MTGLFASGHIVDCIVAVLALEIAAFAVWRRSSLANAVVAALPGICLLLALRSALTGAGWTMIALWLMLSFPAHLADLWRRPP
ncbi:MAG: hypothetical protein JSR81_17385 [Proteobacteria bacterium]|nr:hypothetical protein [Pseudomonadota bacterium]